MQTADEIQTALLCVQIVVGLIQAITTFFFIWSVRITQQQEKDAKQQIVLAQKQMELMMSQYRDSLRPLIVVTLKIEGSNVYEIELRNEGIGPALGVICDPPIDLFGTVVGSKAAVTAYIPKFDYKNRPNEQLFILRYKSLDGQFYATSFRQRDAQFSVEDYRLLGSDETLGALKQFREGFNAARSAASL